MADVQKYQVSVSEPVQKSEFGGGAGADINVVIASSVSRNLALHQLVCWGESRQTKLLAATVRWQVC